ncbi:SDR family NAD(P)-dependent oxidoreductase [Corynebacterium propinquum]|uniref:SDR family NAD(P)-dependent oxidoreductase n=1 Tax=Corynebacterium propinquum TaxID=43769 RepID=A0AAP4BTB2_9CORY|nr:SDR family NAD(P)-dependent oxidoreductase [Corynebacterium propinquum]MCG7231119.1 SDR family NAD(P)-dependent oxidoreductase [Corynebacterium propinquum]MDK4326054.1 SDR family NAD(P)-dependent oxidoreductase [Corynebacterium propinquum]MDK8665541.1 SDR family NAD(P)-dependent oxidoreductase [Corynebacterium propinquum]MDK8722134.1 SDR family NAD(P)-dependent oxidoreductase [Corynebacterium propinquum]
MPIENVAPRTIVITGASDGIGAAAAHTLHKNRPGDRLIIVGRNPDKTRSVASAIGAEYFTADFASLAEVRALADELSQLEHIHALANNAGGIFDGPVTTADGFELTWQINVVAPFLLTSLLQDKLRADDATVVQTASVAHLLMSYFRPEDPNTFRNFSSSRAYGNAKLGDMLLTRYLDLHGLTAVSFHPGALATSFAQTSSGVISRVYSSVVAKALGAPSVGGDNLAYYLAGTPGIHFESGEYYNEKRRPGRQRPIAKNLVVARRIFDDMADKLGVSW